MTTSYTRTETTTFTLTHAKELASKVAADLHICSGYYGYPSLDSVRGYEAELAELLRGRYVEKYEFGFKRDGKRILCWHYQVASDGSLEGNGNPGKLVATVDVSGASFYNYMWRSDAWHNLPAAERAKIESTLPFQRVGADAPADGSGYWVADHAYSSGGVALTRKTFRPI